MKQTPNTSPPLSVTCLEDPLFHTEDSTFLIDPSTKQIIQVRSLTVIDEQHFQILIQNLQKQKKERNDIFLSILGYYLKVKDSKKPKKNAKIFQAKGQKQIVIMHEYLDCKLKDQIHKRQQKEIYFTQYDLWNIFYTLLSAVQYIQNFAFGSGCLNINSIYFKNNQIKLLTPGLESLNSPSIKLGYYYSPEVLQHFKNNKFILDWSQFPKNNIYAVGMIMMELSLLQNCHSCYDLQYFTIAQSCISSKIDRIKSRYSSIFAETIRKTLIFKSQQRPVSYQIILKVVDILEGIKTSEETNFNVSILDNQQCKSNPKFSHNLLSTQIKSMQPSNAKQIFSCFKSDNSMNTHKKSQSSITSLRKSSLKSNEEQWVSNNPKNIIHVRIPSDFSTGQEKNHFQTLRKLKINGIQHSITSFGSFEKADKEEENQYACLLKQYYKMCQTLDFKNSSKNESEQSSFENIQFKNFKPEFSQKDCKTVDNQDIYDDIAKFKQFLSKEDNESSPIFCHKVPLSDFSADNQQVKVTIKSSYASEQTHPAYPKQLMKRREMGKNIDNIQFNISNSSLSQRSISFSPLLPQSSQKKLNYYKNQSDNPSLSITLFEQN